MAQQNAPVNLLTIAPVDENAYSPDSPNNIDQAIEQALETDGSIKKLKNKEQSDKIVKPARVGELITKTLKGLSENPSDNSKIEEEVKNEVISLTSSFPIYKNL